MAISVPNNKGAQLPPMRWAGQVDELAGKQDWRQAITWEICDRAARPVMFHILAKLKGMDDANAKQLASDVEEMVSLVIDAACNAAEGLRHVSPVPESVSDEAIEKLVCRVFTDGFRRLHWNPKAFEGHYYKAVVEREDAARLQGMISRLHSSIHHDDEV